MNRLTDNDLIFGFITLARWKNYFAAEWISHNDQGDNWNQLRFIAFGWCVQILLPRILQPLKIRHEANWDEETIKRLGRNHWFDVHRRVIGFSLSNMGNGYDFFQVHYGARTHDSLTDKTWCKHLPWKQWKCVRCSVYEPDGKHFSTEERGKFFDFIQKKDKCPASYFKFRDYDGEEIAATCVIEEREWHRGEGWFTWLKYFYPAKIRRSLDLKFSAEVGTEKGSWKGGTIGHGIDMRNGETPLDAFQRYCAMEHERKGRSYRLCFLRECSKDEAYAVAVA